MSEEELAARATARTWAMFAGSYGTKPYNPEDLVTYVRNVKACSEFKGVRTVIEENRKKQKKEEGGPEVLTSLLQQRDESLANSALEVYANKHIAPYLKRVQPTWHPPWKLMRVISGHQGWVRCIAMDPMNSWFATGSSDRTIKIWDLVSGQLKLTLVGHINALRALCVSERHSYLFSCSEDKTIKCWDLEYNKVVRSYHGHLTGVYCMKLHPTLDLLISGGRDCVGRVWDIRTKTQIHVLEGHSSTVWCIDAQAGDPAVVTGSADCTVRLWDLGMGRCTSVLTHHKKAVRCIAFHKHEYSFISAGADCLRLWSCPDGAQLRSFQGHSAIFNSMAINDENVLVTGADDGSLCFWDYDSGYLFHRQQTRVQPGSLSCESAVLATTFDKSGLRLLTGECDKTIKVWKEDETATEETHPLSPEAGLFYHRTDA